MGKTLKLFIILFIINFAIFAIGDATHVNDYVLYLFLLPVSIIVSIIVLIVSAIRNARTNYLAKGEVQRKTSRKRNYIVLSCILAGLFVAYVLIMFACGYKLPGRDRHKNWPYFPGSSNPEMVLTPVPDLYIYNIQPIKNTPYFFMHFTRDSVLYHEVSVGGGMHNFGITDSNGNFKIEYQKSTVEFLNGENIIVQEENYSEGKLPALCDVIDLKTLTINKVQINKIPFAASKEDLDKAYGTEQERIHFKEKYQTEFFRNLKGVESIEPDKYNAGGNYRGYTLFKDTNGSLYQTATYDETSLLDILSPQVAGYTSPKNAFGLESKAPNIKPTGEPIILYNDANGGLGSSGLYYEYHQTWLLYYSALVGQNVTSFKIEGSDKNAPYTTFYQLNKAERNSDTLVFVADGKIYKLYNKRKGTK
jgi:hypothetical protein